MSACAGLGLSDRLHVYYADFCLLARCHVHLHAMLIVLYFRADAQLSDITGMVSTIFFSSSGDLDDDMELPQVCDTAQPVERNVEGEAGLIGLE